MQKTGFILPTVLTVSLAVIAIITSLLMITTASYQGYYKDHYQKMADQAAEAGSAYATACLNLSSHIQSWGPAVGRNNLTPNTNCNGTNSYPTNMYVYSDSDVRTYFTVGDLDYSYPFSAQISAQGVAEELRPDGSVSKTYTSVQKKVITWPTDVEGQMSASGTNRTCAIVNYQVYCWGFNRVGQLGDGRYVGIPNPNPPPVITVETASNIDSLVPVKVLRQAGVMAGKKMVKIFVAQHHSCALSDDGKMYCWGYNNVGQLGTGDTNDSAVPVQVGGVLAGLTITDIGGAGDVSCAIAGGKIYCWGRNSTGATGRGTTSGNSLSPGLVSTSGLPANYTATALSKSGSRARNMCAIVAGNAYCWGQNNTGAVGNGNNTDQSSPVAVTRAAGILSGKTVTEISLDGYNDGNTNGYAHVCAVASGRVYCWGENNSGQLGISNTNPTRTTSQNTPTAVVTSGVLNGRTIQNVNVGVKHSCVRADGGVYCWGNNGSGQVGNGNNTTQYVPVAVAQEPGNLTASNVISIGAGANRGCAVVVDGRTFCWGLNGSGQIGDGTKINRNVPTESLFLRPTGNQFIF